MAALLGVTREYYVSVESGKRFPSTGLLRRICSVTGFRDSLVSDEPSDLSLCGLCSALHSDERDLVEKIIQKLSAGNRE